MFHPQVLTAEKYNKPDHTLWLNAAASHDSSSNVLTVTQRISLCPWTAESGFTQSFFQVVVSIEGKGVAFPLLLCFVSHSDLRNVITPTYCFINVASLFFVQFIIIEYVNTLRPILSQLNAPKFILTFILSWFLYRVQLQTVKHFHISLFFTCVF